MRNSCNHQSSEFLAGEVNIKKNKAEITEEIIEKTVRDKVKDIGYEQNGFHWKI